MTIDAVVELQRHQTEPRSAKEGMSFLQGALVGAIAGSIEISLQQPTVAWKNALQDRRPLPFSPKEMYRGVGINVVSMAPITAMQFGAMQFFSDLLKAKGELTSCQKIGCAASAGALSALMSSPAELLVIQQQKTGFALGKQFTEVAGKFGAARLYRGFPMTAGREALFTAGYLGLGPIAKASLQDNFPLLKENDGLALLAGGCAAGLVAGVLTHPLDTVKTRLQSDIAREVYKGPWAAAKVLWKEEGAAAFYKGFLPRCARLCGAVIILNKAGGILEEIIVDNNILAFGK